MFSENDNKKEKSKNYKVPEEKIKALEKDIARLGYKVEETEDGIRIKEE